MCEEHLYWLIIDVRWLDDANFRAGPARIFASVPAPLRPLVKAYVRRTFRRTLHLQGVGRHNAASRLDLARAICARFPTRSPTNLTCLAKNRARDASVGAFVIGTLAKVGVSPLRDAAKSMPNLVAYGERMTERFFPAK